MKKTVVIILENGEETLVGYAYSLYEYFKAIGKIYVPMNGDRKYLSIRNIYNDELDQFVTYKLV